MPGEVDPTVLVVRHSGLGDLLVALPAMRALRRHYPGHRITMTCPSWLVPLAERLDVADRLLSETVEDSADPMEHERADSGILRRVLAGGEPAAAVVALRVPDPGLLRELLAREPRVLMSYAHPDVPSTAGFPQFDFSDHILLRWGGLLQAFGVGVDLLDVRAELAGPLPHTPEGHTLVHVGAGSPARRWPASRWSAVAGALEARGRHVLLTGSAGEQPIVREVRRLAGLPADRDVSGDTDALELATLVSRAGLVLSTETGVAHLATVFHRRSVTLFGPTPPAWWGPPAGCALQSTIWKGRLGDPYRDACDPGLLEISVEDVLRAVDEVEARTESECRLALPAPT